jgi:hypothetical protein
MFKVLKAIAHGGSANFAPLEKTLLSSLQEKLGSEAGGLLQKQVGETDLIQRHSGTAEASRDRERPKAVELTAKNDKRIAVCHVPSKRNDDSKDV